VAQELKQELEVVSLVTLAVHHVLELRPSRDRVVLQSLTANGEHTEDGVHVQQDVDSEPKRELEVVSLVIPVEHHAQELHPRQDLVAKPSYTAHSVHTADGVLVQHNVVLEHKRDLVFASITILVVMHVLDQLLSQDDVVLQ
jgi:hypothetical protein